MARVGKYGGEKVRYPDGVGCCIWTYMKDKDGEETSGICYDFDGDDLDKVAELIEQLRTEKETAYEPDPEQEERERRYEEKQRKWWRKLLNKIDDVGVHLTPFDWGFRRWLITRPVQPKGANKLSKWCKGFAFGPFTVTW